MADHELSTRELAETPHRGASAAPDETKEGRSDQNARAEPTGEEDTLGEMAPADEPSARERVEIDEHADDPHAVPRRDDTAEQAEPESGSASGPAASGPPAGERGPLLPQDQSERFTGRWQEIQTGFVDEPRESVAKADALVAELMQELAANFSEERERLEAQWEGGDDVSTEDLRVALTRYRSFFDRLLSA
jgi:hypothetical protein